MARLITGTGSFTGTGGDFPTLNAATRHIEVVGGRGAIDLPTLGRIPLSRISYPFYLPLDHEFTGTVNASITFTPAARDTRGRIVIRIPGSKVPGLVQGDRVLLSGAGIPTRGFINDSVGSDFNNPLVVNIDRTGTFALITIEIIIPSDRRNRDVVFVAGQTAVVTGGGHADTYSLEGDSFVLAQEPAAATRALHADIITDEQIEAAGGTFIANSEHYNNSNGIDIVAGHGSAVIKNNGAGPDKRLNLNELSYPIALSSIGELSEVSGQVFFRERAAVQANIATIGGRFDEMGNRVPDTDRLLTINSETIISGQGQIEFAIERRANTNSPYIQEHEPVILNLNEIDLPQTITIGTNQRINGRTLGSSVMFIHRA